MKGACICGAEWETEYVPPRGLHPWLWLRRFWYRLRPDEIRATCYFCTEEGEPAT